MNWFYRSLRSKRNPQDRLWVVVVCRYVRATDNADCWLTTLFGGCSFRGRSMFLKGQPACTQRDCRRRGCEGTLFKLLQYCTLFVGVAQCSGGMSLLVFPKGFICQQTELIELAPATLLLLRPPAKSLLIIGEGEGETCWNIYCCRFWLILYIWISSFTLLNSWVCLILHSKVASTVLLQCLSCIRQQKTGSGAQNCFETSAQLRPALQFL